MKIKSIYQITPKSLLTVEDVAFIIESLHATHGEEQDEDDTKLDNEPEEKDGEVKFMASTDLEIEEVLADSVFRHGSSICVNRTEIVEAMNKRW